ncbi:MAG: polysaccharide pyruvyl transferase family protein [Candidatus Hydrogenedentes bacterium]|nr:polysaccharide pyruvyl transferase family protein [Candidatus Hydrogenedentota bacterium]
MKRSVLVFFSWSFNNIGDIGITPGLLRLFQEHAPDARMTVVANSHTVETREYLKDRFPGCDLLATPFHDREPSLQFQHAFDSADLIVYNSGATLSYGRWAHNWAHTMPFTVPLIMARDAGKPYGIYGQSFDRFAWPSDALFRDLLRGAAFLFARESDSLAYLNDLGIAAPVTGLAPDATFGFDLRDEDWADSFMATHELVPRQFITLTIRTSGQGFIDEVREEAHAAKLRELVVEWVRRTGYPVLLCPEVRHEIEPARRLIHERLPANVRESVRFMEDFWLPDQAFSVYARARIVVSMEMHSVIMAVAAGTPAIHPRFAEAGRKAWILRDLGLEEWLYDVDAAPAAVIAGTPFAIHNDYEAALEKAGAAMATVAKGQAESMAVVRQVLEQKPPRARPG